jgi:hypothetical protein
MEEEGIVEGVWEKEGNRKVKRYYLKDVRIEYGKEGLRVSSEVIPVRQGVDLKKELIGRLIKLPLMILFVAGILLNVLVLQVVLLAMLIWYMVMTTGFYRRYHFMTSLLSIPLYCFYTLVVGGLIAGNLLQVPVPLGITLGLLAAVLMIVLVYQARYYQMELEDLLQKNRVFVNELERAPAHIKLFYLPGSM